MNGVPGVFALTKVLDAPRELVWKAWTQPERLARWWGPRGFTTPVSTIGMTCHYVALHPDDIYADVRTGWDEQLERLAEHLQTEGEQ